MSSSSAPVKGDDAQQGFVFDKFIDTPDKTPQEQQTEELFKFVKEYGSQLKDIESALDATNLSEVWDPHKDPVKFNYSAYEPQTFSELLNKINDKDTYKILLSMNYLCWEMRELADIARERFYPQLAVFGEIVAPEDVKDGGMHLQFGQILKPLMDLWNFIERVSDVVHNTVQQLASVYMGKKTR